MELLVAVVGQNRRPDLVGDAEHEGITAADGAGRWADDLVVGHGGVELGQLGLVDAVAERCVGHHGDQRVGELVDEGHHRLVQLLETGQGATFGSEVRSVDDDVTRHNACQSSTRPPGSGGW
ncbi:MAG: hypothetical protein V9E89_02765 [Ilumatobacteraceae bacterium]